MAKNPKRGPLQLSRSAWELGIHPYALPQQWGVAEPWIGCGNEIVILLDTHKAQDYYLEERLS